MYAGLAIGLLFLLGCPQTHAKDEYDEYDEYDDGDRYTFDELKQYLDAFGKKMQNDLNAFETRINSRLGIELKRVQQKLLRRVTAKIKTRVLSQVEDRITDLIKDGTMKSFVDNALLDQVNSLQKGMNVVKVYLNSHAFELGKMSQVIEGRERMCDASSGKVISEIQDVNSRVNKSVMEMKVMKEEMANMGASVQETADRLTEATNEIMSVKKEVVGIKRSVNAAKVDIRSNTFETSNLKGEMSLITEKVTVAVSALENLNWTTQLLSRQSEQNLLKINKVRRHLNLSVFCDVPTFAGSMLPDNCNFMEEGSICRLECPKTALQFGPKYIRCLRSRTGMTGYWDWGQSADPRIEKPHCKEPQCPVLRSPRNGALACLSWRGERYCQPQCHEEYDVPDSVLFVPTVSICKPSGEWTRTDVHDCRYRSFGDRFRMPEHYYFLGNCSAALPEITANFLELLRQSDLCEGDSMCVSSNIEVFCGEEDDEDEWDVLDFW